LLKKRVTPWFCVMRNKSAGAGEALAMVELQIWAPLPHNKDERAPGSH
jgi:hypothetical protein